MLSQISLWNEAWEGIVRPGVYIRGGYTNTRCKAERIANWGIYVTPDTIAGIGYKS